MTATGHAIIGTVIATKIGNPALAIPIAFFSHFAADAFPHWDTVTNIKRKGKQLAILQTIADIAFGFILSYFILNFLSPTTSFSYAIFVIFVAQLPDWLTAPYYFLGITYFKWAYTLQKKFDKELDRPWGIINQALLLFLLILLAKVF